MREPPDFFYSENGKQQPKLIFDPAAGSGGFLMEAARRLKISMDGNHHSLSDLLTIKNAFGSFCGSEVQAFPHYIAQVNLLIQLTPVIKQLIDTNQYDPEELSLSIINRDSLSLYNRKSTQLQNGDKISNCRDFDYVCSNPPFIGEKGNKTLFRATIKNYPYWKQYYQGKMDYLYWFVILGLSKLKEGGKLGFITTSYWFTADGATKLRQYILDHALIREIIDLGKTPVFGDAPGQHNLIFVLERSTNPRKRASNQIKTARVKKDKTGLKSLLSHLGKYIDKTHYSDEFIDVFVCPTIQGDLTPKAWNLFHHNETGKILKKIIAHSTPLGQVCYVNQGIISGADRVTQRNIKLLSANAIAMHNIKIGDGIFVLSKKELHSLHLSGSERALIKPFCKNSDIERYRTNLKSQQVLIYTNKEIDIDNYPKIRAHLEKFRPILENKRECREGRLPWFSLHWPRNTGAFEGEKIITPNRAVENTFALSESPLYAMSDVFFITSRTQREKLGYILAILNSSLMDFWFSWTRKGKGGIREYVGTPLSQVPIRRIDFYSPSETAIHDRLVMLASEIATAKSEEKEVLQQEIDAATINLCGLKSIDNLL